MKRKPRRRELGVTLAEYDALLAAQGGGCAACGTKPTSERPRKSWRCRYCKTLHGVGLCYAELCTVCSQARPALRRLDTDHDHATGAVRGLLCHRCNQLLQPGVTSAILRRLADYLDDPPAPGVLARLRGEG